MSIKKIPSLPRSEDDYWEGAEIQKTSPVKINICPIHKKNWAKGEYIDNKDGTASCKYCPWGFKLAGYLKIHEGKVFDLREGKFP